MSDFVITYDLNNPGQNYAAVEKAIKACGEAGRVLETVWYLSSAMTGDQVLAKVWADETLPSTSPAAGKTVIDGKTTAYVCIGPQCSLPVTEPEKLVETIKTARHASPT